MFFSDSKSRLQAVVIDQGCVLKEYFFFYCLKCNHTNKEGYRTRSSNFKDRPTEKNIFKNECWNQDT